MKPAWAFFLPLLALAGGLGAASVAGRNLVVSPPFICPGQSFTVSFEAQAVMNADLSAGAIISAGNTSMDLCTGWGPIIPGDNTFLHGGSGVGGTGACPAVMETCIRGSDPLKVIKPGDAVVAYRSYSLVACAPAWLTPGASINVVVALASGYASFGSFDSYLKLTRAVEISCTKKVAYNQAGYGQSDSNRISVIIETSGAACGTPSFTPTRTSTRTFTSSFTPTPSSTPTPSRTPTPTFTVTPSQSFSSTETRTRTATPTYTVTPSQSFSSTETPTRSATPTATPTRTVTPSSTDTNTPGPTPTFTVTPSVTSTRTVTPSVTPTPSPTDSFTFTATRTVTPSATPTYTATPTQTITTPYSPTSTSTATPTGTETETRTVTLTSTPTPSVSFTATSTPSYTDSMTVTATPSSTPTRTATATRTGTPTLTSTRTVSPSYTVSSTWTASPTITVTPEPVPFHVTVTLYNSAGERVRLLYEGGIQRIPLDVVLDRALVAPGMNQVTMDMGAKLSDGSTLLVWRGENDSAQSVESGAYYFKMEFTDPFGKATSMTRPVQVLNPNGENSLGVYNSAGELVWRANLASLTFSTENFGLDKDVFAPQFDASGLPLTMLSVKLMDNQGAGSTLLWDGRNMKGEPVSSGTYSIKLTRAGVDGRKEVIRSITVLATVAELPEPAPHFALNPASDAMLATMGGSLRLDYSGAAYYQEATVTLYNLAGEAVAWGSDLGRSGSVVIPLKGLAGGVYLGEFSARSISGKPLRRHVKLALLR